MNGPRPQVLAALATGVLLAAVAAAGLLAQGAGSPAGPDVDVAPAGEAARPNILLVSVDTLRADHLGAYGYPRDTTPVLDDLARRGVRFERAFAQSSWTLPSHMSLLTGLYPQTHRVETERSVLPDGTATLAQSLSDAGYRTQGFVSWVYLKAHHGFDRGFDAYEELLPPRHQQGPATHASIRAGAVADRVTDWIEDAPEQPFFLFVHLFDPHMSYEPPLELAREWEPSLQDTGPGAYEHLKRYIKYVHREDPPPVPEAELRAATALYDGEIRFTDQAIGRILDALEARGLLDTTAVVVTSDHGEEFGEHGSMEGHQWTLYDEVLHVPLIVRLPGDVAAGTVRDEIVESIDVAPTLLELAGATPRAPMDGRSLQPLWRAGAGASPDWKTATYSSLRRFGLHRTAVRTREHKLVHTCDNGAAPFGRRPETGWDLFDLLRDPDEQIDVYRPGGRVSRELRALLEVLESEPKAPARAEPASPAPPAPAPLSEEDVQRLRSLGYVE